MSRDSLRTLITHIGCSAAFTLLALCVFSAQPRLAASAQAATQSSLTPCVLIVNNGPCVDRIASLYKQAGYSAKLAGEKDLAAAQAPTVLVIPPKSVFPSIARKHLSEYLAAGGTLIDLCPSALAYDRQPVAPQRVADFASVGGYTATKPAGAETKIVAIPGSKDKGISFSSRMVADGDLAVTIPLERFRSHDRDLICFRARGDYNIDILKLQIEDSSGAGYVSFVELGRGWRSYCVPMEDFARVGSDPQPLDPAKAETLTLGVSTLVDWKAAVGSFAIGPVSLARSSRHAGVMSSAVLRWRPQFTRAKAAFPERVIDPFVDAAKLPANTLAQPYGTLTLPPNLLAQRGPSWAIQQAPVFRGEWKYEVGDELKRTEMRREPLFVAKGQDGQWKNVAEVRTYTDGPCKGATMILFGVDSSDYSACSVLGKALIGATNHAVRTPRIVRFRPTTTRFGEEPSQLCCKVTIANPVRKYIKANVRVELAGGRLNGRVSGYIAPHGSSELEVKLGEVPADFPMTGFPWKATLTTSHGKDTWSDTVDVRKSLVGAARYMMNCQKAYRDGRFGEHFFTEIYAARVLHALGTATGDQAMIGSSQRFCNMLLARQRPDGGLPLGYADNTGVIYTADNGTDVIGLLQIASWMKDDQKARAYLEASRKYFAFREALYVTPEKSERLQARFGKNATGTKAGLYGLGILKSDYVKHDRVPWPELRPEERGVSFVLTISMGAPAELYLLDPKSEYLDVVKRDAKEFLYGKGYSIGKSSHFTVECLYWMRQVLRDAKTQAAIDAKIAQFMPLMYGDPDGGLYFQGRGALRLLSLAYQREISDSPALRAAMLRSVWDLCSESSSYSVSSVGERFPVVSYGPSEGGFRYVAYSSMGLMELLKPGSTLLGPNKF